MNIKNTSSEKLIALNKGTSEEYQFETLDNQKYLSGEKEFDIKIEESADGFSFLTINGITHPVEITSKNQNVYEIMVNGVAYTFSAETPFSLDRKKILDSMVSQSSTILLKAPMPGKILDVLVKAGDSVKAGDTLLILEAMKMQNAILASTKATVKKVLVKA
ncbi:MAG: hypothetical protein RL662_2279, partial [Bacteroidota bacterium]